MSSQPGRAMTRLIWCESNLYLSRHTPMNTARSIHLHATVRTLTCTHNYTHLYASLIDIDTLMSSASFPAYSHSHTHIHIHPNRSHTFNMHTHTHANPNYTSDMHTHTRIQAHPDSYTFTPHTHTLTLQSGFHTLARLQQRGHHTGLHTGQLVDPIIVE